MRILVPLTLCIALASCQSMMDNIFQRQTMSYTTNVVHPDQHSQSSVSVSFNPTTNEKIPRYTTSFKKAPTFASANAKNTNTQLFNVGYSVRFKNPVARQVASPSRPNLDEGEIITGTRKANEQVAIPQSANSLTDDSGSKPTFEALEAKPEDLYLSPTTQQYLKNLEVGKPTISATEEARKYQQNYSWRNLGPSAEIIRSSEIPLNHQPIFNHASALGRSQTFDFTNGVNDQHQQQQASSLVPTYNPYQSKTQFLPPISQHIHTKLNHINQIPTSMPQVNTGSYNLPVDTSLLRDPYLTTNMQSVPNDNKMIPIHFNVRPLEDAMKNQFNLNKFDPYHSGEDSYAYQQQYVSPQPHQYLHQKKEDDFRDPYFQHNQETVENNSYNHNKFQYKIYGKPQPLKSYKFSGYKTISKDLLNNHRQPRQNPYKYLMRPHHFKQPQFQRRISVDYF
ncbi:unnamed protein product [Brassicogethes aeneus]|uniref:Uncharacterized protein n=1 Tax=Brassicogethes aeneus TaxID=1431903 RepID=A0A9P0BEJ5_BRAAE|nr:unnamed protein product [Brassicogethes aeneus]